MSPKSEDILRDKLLTFVHNATGKAKENSNLARETLYTLLFNKSLLLSRNHLKEIPSQIPTNKKEVQGETLINPNITSTIVPRFARILLQNTR